MANIAREFNLDHLSFSQLYTFSGCPYKWYLQKVKRVPMRPVFTMVSGRAVHKGLETNNLEIQAGRTTGLRPGEIVEVAVTELEQSDRVDEMLSAEGVPMSVSTAKDILCKQLEAPVRYYKDETEPGVLKDKGAITAVEQPIDFEVEGVRFEGVVDLVQEQGFLDYKLTSRKKSAHQVRYDPQLRMYEAVLEQPGEFIQLIRGAKRNERTPVPADAAAAHGVAQWMKSIVAAIKVALQSGVFPRCTPGKWECSKKTCPFFRLCWSKADVESSSAE